MEITDLPVGGCRRHDTLECLSDVEYRGEFGMAYWVYTDSTLENHLVDGMCNKTANGCRNSDIGWHSTLGIYKKDKRYYGVVRLGRKFENATQGLFTCHSENDSGFSVSVNIIASKFYLHSRPMW